MKNRQLSTGVIGAIVLVISMIVFFLATAQRDTLEWICLTLILFSEVLFFGGMMGIEHYAEKESGTFLRSGVVTVLTLYCIVSLVVTFFFLMGIGNALRPLLMIQLVLLAAALIAIVIFLNAGKGIARKNRAVEKAFTYMQALQDYSATLAKKPSNGEFSSQLDKITEAIRFSDNSLSSSKDGEIFDQLSSLEVFLSEEKPEKAEEVSGRIEDLLWLIEQRNLELKSMKGGRL